MSASPLSLSSEFSYQYDVQDAFANVQPPPPPPSLAGSLELAVKIESVAADIHASDPDPKGKLFECPLHTCRRRYRRKGDLAVHFKRKHKDIPDFSELREKYFPSRSTKNGKAFHCTYALCPCGFKDMRGLARHIKKKH